MSDLWNAIQQPIIHEIGVSERSGEGVGGEWEDACREKKLLETVNTKEFPS